MGKTTNSTKFPKPLLLAFEKGYNALAGVMAAPINKWTEFLKVLKQLRSQEAKDIYETIIIDTADIAYDLCEKYVCDVNGVEKIGEIPFGAGYGMVEREFDKCLREILALDYGLVIISHAEDKSMKTETGEEYLKIVPTLNKRARKVCTRMCDIIGYSRIVSTKEGGEKTILFMRGTARYEAGSRFKYTPDHIEFSYKNLVDAIHNAIDKQAQEDGGSVSDERTNLYAEEKQLDFGEVKAEFNFLTKKIMEAAETDEEKTEYKDKITEIIEKHLGKGRKIAECTRDQVDIIDIVNDDLKDFIKKL